MTSPNSVNPPFWLPRFDSLLTRLKKNWLLPRSSVAGLSSSGRASEIVPRVACVGEGSLMTGVLLVIASKALAYVTWYPPVCQMNPGRLRWTTVLS